MPQHKKPKPKRKHAHLHSWARIDRAGAMHNARVTLGAAYELLEADADFALDVLQQAYVLRAAQRPSLTSFCALLSFYRATELLDGISVLAKAGCVLPMKPLARSLLEAVMSARYLTTVNDERIAASYIVSQTLAHMEHITQRASEHADGSAPTIAERRSRAQLEHMLAEERLFRDARNELERLSLSRSVPAPWYEAFDGPRTLGGMSGRLNDSTLEKVFISGYDLLSSATHGTDSLHGLQREVRDIEEIEDLLKPLRQGTSNELVVMVRICHDLFLSMLTHHLNYFREIPAGMTEYRALEDKLRLSIDPAR